MIFVLVQFLAIALLIFTVDFLTLNIAGYILLAISIVVGFISLKDMQPRNINVLPELKRNHILITSGIYKYIRHPMYLSLLIFAGAIWLNSLTIFSSSIYLILIITLTLKSNLEEKYLLERFENYANYQQKTGRFLPRLWKN